ncbi:MAG: zinc ribbon domain-containing protein [Caldisphaera sp.]|jgi:hypothetical protein|nr:zinc ribbon domain-containing protein [Caldisphaera sp.]
MLICPVCGASNPEGSAYCMVCGSKLQTFGIPASILKKYDIYVNNGKVEFRNENNVSEITIKRSGLLVEEVIVSDGESIIGKFKGDSVYDSSGNILLAVIKRPNLKPTQDKLKNYVKSTISAPTGVTVVRKYWIEDASGNVIAKTVSEEPKQGFLSSINYLIYNIVDEKETIARVEPRISAINVKFLHLRYHLYIYSQKLEPIMLASLIYAIKRGDDEYEALFTSPI